jgi:hypothetical protein
MKRSFAFALALGTLALLPGCNNGTNTNSAYTAAINDHLKATPVCLWAQPKKLPAQETTSDDAKTEGYDALTQAGLLTRTTAEKKVFIIASKQVSNYDLSDSGRTTWVPDPTQPGYGNFCYGHREVASIDSSTPSTNAAGAKTATVAYPTKISDVPSWANSEQMKTAFPSLAADLAGPKPATATLVQNGDAWAYSGQ